MNDSKQYFTRLIKTAGLLTCILVTLALDSAAQSNVPLDDPLFGIGFNPAQIHFENAPAKIGQSCDGMKNRVLWVFARTVYDGKEYFILNGYFPSTGSTSRAPESDFGIGVILDGSACAVMTSETLMSGDVPSQKGAGSAQVPPAVLDALAADAITRMESAFRGKDRFKVELSRAVAAHDAYQTSLPTSLRADYPPSVRKRIDDLLKEP